jgi:hypothetical protein
MISLLFQAIMLENKAFAEFLIAMALLLLGLMTLYLTQKMELNPLVFVITNYLIFGISIGYCLSSIMVGSKHLIKKSGKKIYSI